MCRGTQVASLLGTDPAGLLKNICDLFKVEDAVEAQPLLRQPIFGPGILTTAMVEKDHDVLHLQPRCLQLGDALKHAAARDQDVVHHDNGFTFIEFTLDHATGAMGFYLLPWVHQRFMQLQR